MDQQNVVGKFKGISSRLKKEEVLANAMALRKLENIRITERNQPGKDKYCLVLLPQFPWCQIHTMIMRTGGSKTYSLAHTGF